MLSGKEESLRCKARELWEVRRTCCTPQRHKGKRNKADELNSLSLIYIFSGALTPNNPNPLRITFRTASTR
jgi:hypothetical protein